MTRTTKGGHLAILGVAAALTAGGLAGCGSPAKPQQPGPQPPAAVATPAPSATTEQPRPPAVATTPEPTRIEIASIGVRARVYPLGLEKNGTISVPPLSRVQDTGWYKYGPPPGEVGPAVIVGHVDSRTGPGVFHKLSALRPGAQIKVARKDGSTPTFRVERLERVPKDRFPTDRVYGSVPRAELRLITCGGAYNRATGHYTDNVIVYAVRVA